MSFRVLVEAQNGHFTVTLAGVPNLKAVEASRAAAIASLKEAIHREVEQGEMVELDTEPLGLSDLAGKYADDPTLRELEEEAYRMRDAGRKILVCLADRRNVVIGCPKCREERSLGLNDSAEFDEIMGVAKLAPIE